MSTPSSDLPIGGDSGTTFDDDEVFRLPKGLQLQPPVKNSPEKIQSNRQFWKKYLSEHNVRNIVAPMVDQSELAFRMFLRDNGAHLAVTPMIHAHLFVNDTTYRRNALAFCKRDRPLIVQFCANKADTFLDACRLVEGFCDGVDLNLGCPQMVAKRGHYGSYLEEEVDLVCDMVSNVRDYCQLPVSCKIRILDCPERTRNYAQRLVDAGASLITVHGRTRIMKGAETGIADWERIRMIVDSLDVPVVANGNIQMPGDVDRCIKATGAAAVMSAEGILYNPLLFANKHEESWKVANDYLDYATRYQADVSAIRAHVFRITHHCLLEYADLRLRVSTEHTINAFQSVVEEMRIRTRLLADAEEGTTSTAAALVLFDKIRTGEIEMDPIQVSRTPHWISKPYFRLSEIAREAIVNEGEKTYKEKRKEELQKMADEMGVSIKQAKKRERRKLAGQKIAIQNVVNKRKFPPCSRCSQPGGQGCKLTMCKKCCKFTSKRKRLDCEVHRAKWSHLPPMITTEQPQDMVVDM